jgi:hypothetical protein
MSPAYLGALPLDQPAPTGLVQLKRGAGGQIAVPGNYSPLVDGIGGTMKIAITPTRPGWWCLRAETIFITNANWISFAWYIEVLPADYNGDQSTWNYCTMHSAQGWQQSCLDATYRLKANTAYTAEMRFAFTQGEQQYFYAGPGYTFIAGEFVGEGRL